MKLFLQKTCKIFERCGLRPQTSVPPAAGGFAPKPPASSGGRLRPQTPIGFRRLGAPPPDSPNSPPIANFWLRAWLTVSGATRSGVVRRLKPPLPLWLKKIKPTILLILFWTSQMQKGGADEAERLNCQRAFKV